MKRKHILSIILVFVLFIASSLQPTTSTYDVEKMGIPEVKPSEIAGIVAQYDSLLSADIESSNTVGAAVAIIYNGRMELLKCFGVKKAGEKDPVDRETIFRLASVSKTMTGVLAGILSQEGTLHLNTKVKDYLPDFKLSNPENTENLTLRHLLSHTSGLVPHAYDNLVEEHVPFNNIIERLSTVQISAPPGQLYGYQNVVFSLYDTIASLKTATNFSSLLKEKLFDPFGMYTASSGFEAFEHSSNKAYPHYGWNGNYRPLKLNDRYYNTIPAAGINASISDMAQFVRSILNSSSDINLKAAIDTVLTPQVTSPLRRSYFRNWDRVDSKYYALGWRIIDYKGRQLAYHGGYVQGYRAEIALCRKENIGIVFLTNSPNKVASSSVPNFLNMYFDYKDEQGNPVKASIN